MFRHRKSQAELAVVEASKVTPPLIPDPLFPGSSGALERALRSYGAAVAREAAEKQREAA